MITRRHLFIFKTVAETKSMSKAAKALYISQPTISQKIQEIENFYGVKLFERYSKTLLISDEGNILLEKANQILESFDEIDHIFSDINQFPLRIGATLTIGGTIFAPMLKTLKLDNPGLQLQVYVDNSHIIEEMILNNKLDIALIEGTIDHPDILVEPVINDQLIFVASTRYEGLKGRNHFTLEDLKNLDLIDREEGSGTREQLESCLKDQNFTLTPTWQCHSWEAVKQAVLNDHGIALVPVKLVENELQQGLLQIINVSNIILERKFSICVHKNKTIDKKMQAFIKTCKTYS